MGTLMCLPAQLACCFSSAACTLCSCLPACSNSVTTRIMYGVLLFLTAIVSMIMLTPEVKEALMKLPVCSQTVENLIYPGSITTECEGIVGYFAVYRICFVVSLFFLAMGLIMTGVRNARDVRSGLQNGFWGIKYLIIIAGCFGAFYIPQGRFLENFMMFGMIGGFFFILIQVYLIIVFANGWSEKWQANCEESHPRVWFAAIFFCTMTVFAVAIAGIALLFVYYTHPDSCGLNKFFISFNLILCTISTVISVLPPVQERRPASGLLQSSLITLYVVYLTWSAIANNPDDNCKPDFLKERGPKTLNRESIAGIILWMFVVIYSSIRTASSGKQFLRSDAEEGLTLEEGESQLHDEGDECRYDWSFFHFVLAFATLYIMMTLTNWGHPTSVTLATFSANAGAMWVKMISSWLCLVLYNWWNLAPMAFPNRDFS